MENKTQEHSIEFLQKQEDFRTQPGNRLSRRIEASRKRHSKQTRLQEIAIDIGYAESEKRATKVANRVLRNQKRKDEREATGKEKAKLTKKRLKIQAKNKRKLEKRVVKKNKYKLRNNNKK